MRKGGSQPKTRPFLDEAPKEKSHVQQPSERIKVAQFGLGPIGIESVRLAAEKSWIEVVGGIDIDPAVASGISEAMRERACIIRKLRR